MTTSVKTTVLNGKKYQMIVLPKGSKAPQGVETMQFEGENYILSPIVTASPAPKVEEKKEEAKAVPAKTETKASAVPWWAYVLGGILILLLIVQLWKAFPRVSAAPASETPVAQVTPATYAGGPVTLSGDCVAKATTAGDPNKGSSICKDQTSSDPVARMQSGSKIAFGSITFDAESRVWILSNFVVPASSSYAFDYSGREQKILDAPFVVGSEMSPVTGKPFEICWDTTSNGCVPPVKIEFFQ